MAADDKILNRILQKLDSIENAINNDQSLPLMRQLNFVDIELTIRRVRDAHFDHRYFTDSAWEILLDLKRSAELKQVSATGDLGLAAGIPHTTLLRYIDILVKDGFVVRYADPNDGRRVLVELSDLGMQTMNTVFDTVSKNLELPFDFGNVNHLSPKLAA